MKKVWSTMALGLVTFSAAHAAEVTSNTASSPTYRWEEGSQPSLLSAQPDTDRNFSFYSNTEVLVMSIYQSDLDYAVDGNNDEGDPPFIDGRVRSLRFDFDVGVRQTWGVHGGDSGWDAHFTHTHFGARRSAQSENDDGLLWPILWSSSEIGPQHADRAKFTMKVDHNLFDWIVSHSYLVNDHLALTPHAGLRCLLHTQHQKVKYSGGDFDDEPGHVHYHSKATGWGANFGGEFNWHLGGGFCMFGRGSGSVLACVSNWTLEHERDDVDYVDLKQRLRNMRTGMDGAVGFSFERGDLFSWLRYAIVSFAFEFSRWDNMDNMRRIYGHANEHENISGLSSPSDHGVFGMWGFVFGFRFDY